MAPIPNRGKLNEPANIPYIAERISETKGVDVSEVADSTTETAQSFFNLPRAT